MTKSQYRKKVILMSLSVMAFLGLILSAAWAAMSVNATHGNVNVNTTIANRPVFTATSTDIISLQIDAVGQEVAEGYVADSDTANISILLSSSWSSKVTCTYDIIWEWASASSVSEQYQKTSGVTKEYVVSGVSNSDSFEEIQLNNYSASSRKQKLYTSSITVNAGQMANDTWTFTNSFYKATVPQSNHKGHSYSGKIYVENVLCNSDILPSEYQEVEYIKSDANSYLKLGINDMNENLSFNIKFNAISYTGYGYVMGIWGPNDSAANTVLYFNSSHHIGGWVYKAYSADAMDKNYQLGTDAEVYINKTTYKINNRVYTNFVSGSGSTPGEIWIFRRNGRGTAAQTSSIVAKLYKFKVWNNGTLVRNLVPCYRKNDTVIGMYDTVNDIFYTNQGSGNFTKGANV